MTEAPSPFSMLLFRHTKRRAFITGLGGAVAWPVVARAQQPAKIPTVGFLYPGPQAVAPPRIAAFLAGLRAGGYREKNRSSSSRRLLTAILRSSNPWWLS